MLNKKKQPQIRIEVSSNLKQLWKKNFSTVWGKNY